ncbi:hypothetical protein [Bdellovibrio bacteriovorus]|uniref:hypothetical protein n=1 Tax=Bdellovibrio bacteriovorus TaxID=959 RepID=UPI0035A68FCC
MSKFKMFAMIICLAPITSFAQNKPRQAALANAEWVYWALSHTFPEYKKSIGPDAYEFYLTQLECRSMDMHEEGEPSIKVECNGRPATELFLSLLNAGAAVNRDKIGSSTIKLRNIACGVEDLGAAQPEYYCTAIQ